MDSSSERNRRESKERRPSSVGDLEIGDLIEVRWLDASEYPEMDLNAAPEDFDTPITSYGIYLGVKGARKKHLVIAKEILPGGRFHPNVIPLSLIERIEVCQRRKIDAVSLKRLERKVRKVPLKRFLEAHNSLMEARI